LNPAEGSLLTQEHYLLSIFLIEWLNRLHIVLLTLQSMNKKGTPTFSKSKVDFVSTLNKRVNDYFRQRALSRHANPEMVVKTFIMFSLYLVPYALILSGAVTGVAWLVFLVVVMSLGLAGIGLSVMHDANHGAYAKKKWLNNLIGYSLNLVGANAFNWKMQHNVLHHSYTNVIDQDEDISPRGVLRLTPHTRWKWIHRYQFIYAWFLYGLMTVSWMTVKDFNRILHYHKTGLAKRNQANMTKEWIILIATKLVYFTYIFVLPVMFTSLAWWHIALGIFLMHYIAGFMLAIIFQPAHVSEGNEFPLPDDENQLQHNWAVHQLLTTTNFSNKSRWFSWYVGGLNFQIEHHLFPNICHVHYRKIASIVRATAIEYGLPYRSEPTFVGALALHAQTLKKFGARPK
jgi:linoleoyl-CoA desaturase